METRIIDKSIYTKVLDIKKTNNIQTKVINNNIQTKIINSCNTRKLNGNQTQILSGTELNITSYRDNSNKNIFLGAIINKGSWNTIYKISSKKNSKLDTKLVIRISNDSRTVESINAELRGIKVQYKLCTKSPFIGNVIDYGIVQTTINCNPIREYSIVERYGLSLN